MNLVPSPEQDELAASVRRFLGAQMPVEPGADRGVGVDTALWRKIADLGWLGIGLDAEAGGVGGSVVEQGLVFREIGRGLGMGPFLGSVLAASLAARSGRTDIVQAIVGGDATAQVAEPWRDKEAAIGAGEISGSFRVIDRATDANLDWVAVIGPREAALVRAESFEALAKTSPKTTVDPSMPVEIATGHCVPEFVLDGRDAAAVLAAGRVLVAASLVGILEASRDASVAYVCVREQFGKPIGSFQAVKHRCADMAVRAEAAATLTWFAALSLAENTPEATRLCSSAKALASEYAISSAHDNVQNHGGMGFTAECSAHLFVKRALALSVTLGSPDNLLAEVARC